MKIYTRVELEVLSLNQLRNIDIYSKDQEVLIQSVIDGRMISMPRMGVPLVFPSSMTDNMTIEKERELQKKMDDHNEANKRLVLEKYQLADEEPITAPEMAPLPEMEPVAAPEIMPEPAVEPVVVPMPEVAPEPAVVVPEEPVQAKKKGRTKKVTA